MYLDRGNLTDSLQQADLALQTKPRLPDAWALRGDVLQRQGKPQSALDSYHRALSLVPDDPWARLLSSQVHTRAGRLEDAAADIDKAVAAFDASHHAAGLYVALSARESVYFWMGDLDEHIATCERALLHASTDAQRFSTLVSLASAAVDGRDWQTAEATLATADALSAHASAQDRVRGQAIRSLADYFQGEHRRALASWPAAPYDGVSPSLTACLLNIEAGVHRSLADYEQARLLLSTATDIATQYCYAAINEMIHDSMGITLCSSGLIDEGLALIKNAAIKLDRLHADPALIVQCLLNEACVLRRVGDMPGAYAWTRDSYAALGSPDRFRAVDDLGAWRPASAP